MGDCYLNPTDRPKSVRNRCVIDFFGSVLCCHVGFFKDFSVGVGVFVIELSQISSFFSYIFIIATVRIFKFVVYFKNIYAVEKGEKFWWQSHLLEFLFSLSAVATWWMLTKLCRLKVINTLRSVKSRREQNRQGLVAEVRFFDKTVLQTSWLQLQT